MPIECPKCGFVNPSGLGYCGNCGSLFKVTSEPSPPNEDDIQEISATQTPMFDDWGRISMLLYFGVALIALSGLFYAETAQAILHEKSTMTRAFFDL